MNALWRHRLRPPPLSSTLSREPALIRDLPLEGLRGLCALAVFGAHLFLPVRVVDPRWAPPPQFAWFNLGYAAVLMFFVLSGYVIGLVTTAPATPAEIRAYLVRRFARLWPLLALAVGLSWLLAPATDGRTVLGNLLFLQNDLPYPALGSFPLLPNNPNLWSLNYEAFYYLAFLPVWIFAPRTVWIFVALALPICAHAMGLAMPQLFARYACGGLYWFTGLTLAWSTSPSPLRRSSWPAALLTAYAIWMLAPLRSLCLDWSLYGWAWTTPVSPHRLDFLPACAWLLLAVTGRAPRAQKILAWLCLTIATLGLARQIVTGELTAIDGLAATALIFAWLLARRDFSLAPLQRFAPLGAVSFGLYVIAGPLQLGQRVLFPDFSGSALTFTVRLVGVITGVALTVWLLERHICPPFTAALRRWSGALPHRTRKS